jgi:hypothetical protein
MGSSFCFSIGTSIIKEPFPQAPGIGSTAHSCLATPDLIFRPSEPFNADKVHEDINYTEEDDKAIDDWIAGMCSRHAFQTRMSNTIKIMLRRLGTVLVWATLSGDLDHD